MDDIARACVLTVKSTSSKNEGTCCGILIDTRRGYILTHSSLLAPLLLDKPQLLHQLNSASRQGKSLSSIVDLNIEVILEKLKIEIIEEKISLVKYKSSLVNSAIREKHPQQAIHSASLISIFKCLKFEQAMRKLLPGGTWSFVDNNREATGKSPKSQNDKDDELIYKILPYFVLVKLNRWTPYDSNLTVRSTRSCHVGEAVELLTTPFANLFPEIMLNSVSKGIISNLSGKDRCLILSDARCMPGSEGGPLFTVNSQDDSVRDLTGIVVSSMCWKSGEWLGFSLSCSLYEALASIPGSVSDVKLNTEESNIHTTGSRKGLISALRHVPLVKVGSTWGSGVILGQSGLVLTCSHVIKGFSQNPVKLKLRPHSPFLQCTVIYSSPVGVQFDLAVLVCRNLETFKSCLPWAYPVEGTQVFVVGHSTFGDELDLCPSVTAGVISKVVTINSIPVMIQTTCAVHPGASGGALVNEQGRLVGIVVSNAKDTDTGASFPHINMSVPLVTVWPVINSYLKSRDASVLKHLTLQNVMIDKMWTLGKPASDFSKTSQL